MKSLGPMIFLISFLPLTCVAKECCSSSSGKMICQSGGGVDLSRSGIDGIAAGNEAIESRQRVRESQLRIAREELELERERLRWHAEQEAIASDKAKQNNSNPVLCERISDSTVSCRNIDGKVSQYKAVDVVGD